MLEYVWQYVRKFFGGYLKLKKLGLPPNWNLKNMWSSLICCQI